jgi:hypothetical protein
MNLKEIFIKYPDDEACLNKLMSVRFGFKPFCIGCNKRRSFKKLKGRPVFQCGGGHQISPLAGSVFEKTTTPLQLWFYAMYLMSATRAGISAKQLERELKVTYKTAWRMMKQIRILMGNRKNRLLEGVVEVDESFFGGAGKNRKYVPHFNEKPKDIIMGMIEREGEVVMKKIETTGRIALWEQLEKHVDTKATVMTDQFMGYKNIHQIGYEHHSVDDEKTYVAGKAHTNNIEGLWGRIKPGIKGVYRKVSSQYIESYMDEYCFRFNHRKTPDQMFDLLLAQI